MSAERSAPQAGTSRKGASHGPVPIPEGIKAAVLVQLAIGAADQLADGMEDGSVTRAKRLAGIERVADALQHGGDGIVTFLDSRPSKQRKLVDSLEAAGILNDVVVRVPAVEDALTGSHSPGIGF